MTKVLGRYELCDVLGQGGYAEVWKAYDPQLKRIVAIKLLHTMIGEHTGCPDFAQRFLREARTMASLRHPNIVQIHDMGCDTGNGMIPLYLIMQYVDGPTLDDYLARTSRQGMIPSASNIVHLFATLSSAVDYAHRQGVIHRDIKPSNILLDSQRCSPFLPMGEPLLSDFGLVKGDGLITMSEAAGRAMGTPLYLSPEQAQGAPASRQSDLYALGIILFEMCTGSYPYPLPDQQVIAILQRHIACNPTPPRLLNPALLPAVAAVLLRSLAKDPADRYTDAASMVQALAQAFDVELSPHLAPATG
jgi:serine/threonine protein kinase